jgi:hypothetical protein
LGKLQCRGRRASIPTIANDSNKHILTTASITAILPSTYKWPSGLKTVMALLFCGVCDVALAASVVA